MARRAWHRALAALVALAALLQGASAATTSPTASAPTVALHYGATPPIDALRAFDWVVLDPDAVPDPARLPRPTEWAAYVSVGEAAASRAWSREVPSAWKMGDNAAWGSQRIDVAAPGYADFMIDRVFAPLWARGWRSFFLDTLDSYQAYATTPQARRLREDALVSLIERLHARFPGIRLIFNRGFEIAPRLPGKIAALAAESLYGGYDAASGQYREVPAGDRAWLADQLRQVKTRLGIPVIAIDYAPPADRARARELAARIRADGFIPWVAGGALDTVGVGDLEVAPRRVLLVTDRQSGENFQTTTALRMLGLPLNYLGYAVDLIDVREPLPEALDPGITAAVVTWFSQPVATLRPGFEAWLARQQQGGVKLVLMNQPGLAPDAPLLRRLGLRPVVAAGARRIERAASLVGFETPPSLTPRDEGFSYTGPGEVLLALRAANGAVVDPVGMAPWGGWAFAPYAIESLGVGEAPDRWVIDPIAFLHAALGAPTAPVPDTTTEGGRRMLIAHIDGDGFASRAEMPGSPFAAEVLRREVLERYRVPHTMSVIEGETGSAGQYPQLASDLEAIARRIFALPHVEVASHSYSHPFVWQALGANAKGGYEGRDLNLKLPGYRFSLEREIQGSRDYIDSRLAPPGKRTKVFLWTGDTAPGPDALAQAERAGLLAMNGGGSTATHSAPTLTASAGLGLRRQGQLQVFAPMQNENVYTNLWTGPFYGFQRVIETFDLTGAPRRLKPFNIYYHTYSASKPASLAALHKVYSNVLAQPHTPVFASDYIAKVRDFHGMAIARDLRSAEPRWRVRGDGALRTLRLPANQAVAVGASEAVAGQAAGPQARYVHLGAGSAELALATAPDHEPQLLDANGRASQVRRAPGRLDFVLEAQTAPQFRLASARGCRVNIDGRAAEPVRVADGIQTYEPARSSNPTQPIAVAVACSR